VCRTLGVHPSSCRRPTRAHRPRPRARPCACWVWLFSAINGRAGKRGKGQGGAGLWVVAGGSSGTGGRGGARYGCGGDQRGCGSRRQRGSEAGAGRVGCWRAPAPAGGNLARATSHDKISPAECGRIILHECFTRARATCANDSQSGRQVSLSLSCNFELDFAP
jgi:hypothetical protein